MKIFLILLMLIPSVSFSQTEDEKRAIMAAINKIAADSSRLESRSTRIAEQRNQIEFLSDAIAKAYRTIEVMDTLDNIRKNQIRTETELRKQAEEMTTKAIEDKEKAEKGKKRRGKVILGLAIAVVIETIIIVL